MTRVRLGLLSLGLIAGCGQLIKADFDQRAVGCRDAVSGTLRGECTSGGEPGTDVASGGSGGAPNTEEPPVHQGGSAEAGARGDDSSGGRAPGSSDAGASAGGDQAGAGAGAAAAGADGVGGANPDGDPPGPVLAAFQGPTWPTKLVPVCWRDQLERPDIATHVELLVRNTWGRSGGVRFVVWGYCPADVSGWLSVALDASSEGDVDGIGVATADRRISLGIHMAHFDAAVLHLFGHALGIGHGDGGPGKDVGAGDCEGSDVALDPAGFWERSIMNARGHCGLAELGARDVVMLQTAYGRKGSGALVGLDNRCVDIPGEVAKQWQLLQVYECNFARNQSWYRDTDAHLLVGYAQALAIDIAIGPPTRYLQLYARSQPATTNQQFSLVGGQLRALGNSCVEASGDESGSVQAGPCVQETLQIGSDGRIQTAGGCLTGPPLSATSEGAKPSIAPCEQSSRQVFAFSRTGQLRQGESCLEVVDAVDPVANRALRFASCLAESDPRLLRQQFYYRGRVLSGEQCLHIAGEMGVDGTGLETVVCTPYDASQWWDYYFTDPL